MPTRSPLALAALLLGCAVAEAPAEPAEPPPAPTVATAEGPVTGFVADGVERYYGVPFAAPPVGALRWAPPRPAPARDTTLAATAFAASPMSHDVWGDMRYRSGGFLGWGPGYESSVPELTSILVTLGSTFAVATHEMVASHRRADRARALIGAHRASLAVEDARLAADRAELEGATSTLERETEALERLRAREGRLSDELAAKRADERALINAIHQDLREPLRSVVSFGQLIARRIDEAEGGAGVREYVGYAVDGGRRMAVMLDDLLRYAEAAETDGAEAVDLAEVVGGARRDLHAVVERTGARVDVDAAALPTVYGHPTQLTQLFLNLLNNALKFARPGRAPVVTVTAYPTGESGATVEVRDAGIGIPAAQLDKVFGLFNRAHDGDGYEGSGVGLALCRRIAIAHGAELAVASVEGEGTTFSIAFAQVARPRAGAAPGPSSPAALVAC